MGLLQGFSFQRWLSVELSIKVAFESSRLLCSCFFGFIGNTYLWTVEVEREQCVQQPALSDLTGSDPIGNHLFAFLSILPMRTAQTPVCCSGLKGYPTGLCAVDFIIYSLISESLVLIEVTRGIQ